MNTPNDGGRAFPSPDTVMPSGQVQFGEYGMSLRAYIATAALQGITANNSFECISNSSAATTSVDLADALIAELNKPTT
jgi:hypothetical protein